MKLKLAPLILLNALMGGIFFSGIGIGHAQEESPPGPVYLVQEGDTLISIAIQFGVTVDDLLVANHMSISDLLFIGTPIIIPGLEGVTGILETRTIPYGESLRSLSRRYGIPIEKLVQLNRLVSPWELYAGSSLILPVSSTEAPQSKRKVFGQGQSVLELAVRENTNPWNLAKVNQLSSPGRAVPGDVLLIPGQTMAGPGGFPSPVMEIQISNFFQGETGVVHISAGEGISFQGNLLDHRFTFFPVEPGQYAGLQGVHALADPGLHALAIQGTLADGSIFIHSQPILVRPRGYLFETITVPPALIDPETTNQEEEFIRPLVNQVTPQKYWEGLFLSPSPCPTCINSGFGNRRSYNGSAFTYFHGGVDFPPVAIEITASADGVVIFADYLEVRGNFTLIDHGWGVLSAYLHQAEIFVQPGETVRAGQVIGLIGSTGRSTGAHLHWEIWVGGVQVNPLFWLDTVYP
jgi:murein DD-endopeptidase MepM/ murein hydrolase activator NlpD